MLTVLGSGTVATEHMLPLFVHTATEVGACIISAEPSSKRVKQAIILLFQPLTIGLKGYKSQKKLTLALRYDFPW